MKKIFSLILISAILSIVSWAIADVAIDEAHFPDAAFRNHLENENDSNQDHLLDDEEIGNIKYLYVGDTGIKSMQGIEYMTSLEYLNCGSNQITSLDLSGLSALRELDCSFGELISINVSNCASLTSIYVPNNKISSLNLTQTPALQEIDLYGNRLTTLDVSANTVLQKLECGNNKLTSLDLSGNRTLNYLDCYMNQLTSLTIPKNSELTTILCWNNQLTSLDVSHNPYLTTLTCTENKLSKLNVSGCSSLSKLECGQNNLKSLDISGLPLLTDLHVAWNELEYIDVTKNPLLENFACSMNQLTSVDISQNTVLKEFNCYGNRIESLDVSKNPLLEILGCAENRMFQLNVSKCPILSGYMQQYTRTVGSHGNSFDQFGDKFFFDVFVTVTGDGIVSKPLIDIPEPEETPAPETVTTDGGVFNLSGNTAMFSKSADKNATSLVIPATVKAKGKTYKVTEIKANACKGMQKLTSIVIGKNVKTIGKNAFSRCKKLKTITVKATKLESIGKKAFKGIATDAVFKCPKKLKKTYEPMIRKAGAPKTAAIK